jgi:hypothetical protein
VIVVFPPLLEPPLPEELQPAAASTATTAPTAMYRQRRLTPSPGLRARSHGHFAVFMVPPDV